MLQPRSTISVLIAAFLIFDTDFIQGQYINTSPRQRRQNGEDVTTVLLVDSQGRSTFGRFLSVKPDLGLLTSTARTFIQEGVTTEYATQVLGTTLDNGRLYAHLLTKSSRVLYDNDAPTRSHDTGKKWKIDSNVDPSNVNFVKNTDYISPNQIEPYVVFPTVITSTKSYTKPLKPFNEESDEELKSSPSNNPRVPYGDSNREAKFIAITANKNKQKSYRNDPRIAETSENDIVKDEIIIGASKVREWNNLPTFTVRNEFSPSGFSYLGDFPDFEVNTEKSKATTAAERKAKLLFRPRQPEKNELKTVTYTGFADFTTTVGDTVIIFSPSTAEAAKPQTGHVTKIKGEPTLSPTATLPQSHKTVRPSTLSEKVYTPSITFEGLTTTRESIENVEDEEEEEEEEEDNTTEKEDRRTTLFSMVLDSSDRPMKQSEENDEVDLDAKLSILAKEQGFVNTPNLPDTTTKHSDYNVVLYSSDAIEPSETNTPMLSTPSDEDVAKILASLDASKQTKKPMLSIPSPDDIAKIFASLKLQTSSSTEATVPLNSKSTIFFDDDPLTKLNTEETKVLSGAKTIFFDDVFPTSLEETLTTAPADEGITTQPPVTTTTETKETTTEFKEITTIKEPTTLNEIFNDETTIVQQTTTEMKNEPETEKPETTTIITTTESEKEINDICVDGTKVLPTTSYHHFNVLTTFYIKEGDSTSTSIEPGVSVSAEVGYQTILCNDILPTNVVQTVQPTINDETTTIREEEFTESPITNLEPTTEQATTIEVAQETTPMTTTPREITTEKYEVTESDGEVTEGTTESGEEVELLVKTLYTTFNYLTTYYFGNTSTVSTSKTIQTNMITSTLYPGKEIEPSSVVDDLETSKVTFDDFDIADDIPKKEEDNETSNQETIQATPSLSPYKVKTYFTTYTYFSTIFDGEDDSRVLSRTEVRSSVYTDYGAPNLEPTKTIDISPTDILEGLLTTESDDSDERRQNLNDKFNNYNTYNKTISRSKTASNEQTDSYDTVTDNDNDIFPTQKSKSYVTLHRAPVLESSENSVIDLTDYEIISNMVTNVKSTTSKGDTKLIENLDKRNVLDDQVFSESNNESEVVPSPTLLLQTSYTTFTYFTTTYHGTTSSDVNSSLKTITNIVTETLNAPQTLRPDDVDLPITYFTTFTYWTTSVKKNTTIVTSSEKTITNVETPTPILTAMPTKSILPTQASEIQPTPIVETIYSTFTYFTTSYINDNSSTVYSSLATQSKVVTKTPELEVKQGRAIGLGATRNELSPDQKVGLLSTVTRTEENSGTATLFSTDVYGTFINGRYAQVEESTSSIVTPPMESTKTPEIVVKPTGVLSINKGMIVDADSVSTLFYTTQAIGTYIDNSYAQVIDSTSFLKVDEEKKALLPSDLPTRRTGLVRFIEGAIVQNDTTTLYHSNVLGTVINGSYAQVIESTSSFIVGKKATISPSSASGISPTPTKAPDQQITSQVPISPSPVVIEGSETAKNDDENTTEDDDDEPKGTKLRLPGNTRKNNYTPAIRPFSSRPSRPAFAPNSKRKGASTVTRSDITTPTVTVVPASNKQRFGQGRKSSSANNQILPTASGSRRFSRPKSTSGSFSSSGFGGGRRSSSRIQPTSTGSFGSSSRRGGFRSSSSGGLRSSSLFNLNRPRIRPTAAVGLNRFASTAVTPSDAENDITTDVTDNPTGFTDEDSEETLPTTTEGRRNPLLNRFRRPNIRPVGTPRPAARTTKSSRNAKTTTPKPKPTTRPLATLQNRPRPPNALFPRRGLFTTTTPAPEEEEEYEEEGEDLEQEGEAEDSDYENSDGEALAETSQNARIGRSNARSDKNINKIIIKPFARRRSKRQVQYSRFRRPGARTTTPKEEPTTTEPTKPPRANRFSGRRNKAEAKTTTQSPKRIAPTKASTQGRSQFTLRDSSSGNRPNFKRPTSARRGSPSRASVPKLRNGQDSVRKTTTRSRTSSNREVSRSRGTTRGRRPSYNSGEQFDNYVLPAFDGTITVTHQIPTEVTIPVINGKITEYKNIVTAKYSTQILSPEQYTTSLNAFGKDVTVLLSESTGINNIGATQITQFVLNETPTTSVIFTPTTIRGRKTSFSHVIPSTVYGVEEVVNTLQPALAAQAPLANILLSQLLLGNVGFQQQNPLGFQNPLGYQNPGTPATPTTEFKTKTTTYVTTVTRATSTVIPLTFRGKEILTTIVDTNTEVITATEFITDTVVVTPTVPFAAPGANQLNSLLVPLLLQQQQQQAINPLLQQPAGVFNLPQEQQPISQALLQPNYIDPIDENSAFIDEPLKEETTPKPPKKRKSKKQKPTPAPTPPPKETSVVTLYVSGRQPGEFTTVLSTYVVGEENRRKREITYIPLQPSALVDDLKTSDSIDSFIMPTNKDLKHAEDNSRPTESLESVLGDVNKYITYSAYALDAKPTKTKKYHADKDTKYVKHSNVPSGSFLEQ